MSDTKLSVVRKSIRPQAGDSWATIADRELPKLKTEDGVSSLQSWNLHVYMRAPAPEGSPRAGNPILPSDVIFIEPPMAAA
ncbi:MAG TPA: hypothetical protein EYG02_11430 [Henriciella marina]|uniref:hypothetical protein n=1 Tax=Henriciella sp. TaxID=1968823 RepID=UPI00179C2D68|nr:hypothetical protein [Henriciella sp.]HIG23253.1 hypothetical protein [Henriciella sp.]HIK65626.1 hypothetical protein [Henriciella marina]